MAQGLFSGGDRLVVVGVVLHNRSQGQQVEAVARLPLGPSAAANVMGQPRAQLGAVKGCTPIAGPDSRPPRKGDQSGRSDTGYAGLPSPALQTPAFSLVGV